MSVKLVIHAGVVLPLLWWAVKRIRVNNQMQGKVQEGRGYFD